MKGNKYLYWALIGTFILLYMFVAFVSTLHAITFFKMGNITSLSILLAVGFELGISSVLFAIIMTDNKNRFLAWAMMILLTAVQISANIFSTFKFMESSGTTDWQFFQRVILFGVQSTSGEMYKVIIAYLQGGILPLISLGLTSLVADQIHLMRKVKLNGDIENLTLNDSLTPEQVEDIIRNEIKKRTQKKEESKPIEDEVVLIPKGFKNLFKKKTSKENIDGSITIKTPKDEKIVIVSEPKEVNDDEYGYGPLSDEETKNLIDLQDEMSETKPVKDKIPLNLSQFKSPGMTGPEYVFPNNAELAEHLKKDLEEQLEFGPVDLTNEEPDKLEKKYPNILDELADPIKEPINKPRGWHFKKEFVDDDHNVFELGKFIINDSNKAPTSKK